MKFAIERADLVKAVAQAQSVVERRNTIPILSNVLLEADAGGLVKIMATVMVTLRRNPVRTSLTRKPKRT